MSASGSSWSDWRKGERRDLLDMSRVVFCLSPVHPIDRVGVQGFDMKKLTVLLATVALVACSPRVDTSSPQAYAQSIEKVKSSLPPEKQAKLNHALLVLALGGDSSGGIFESAPLSSPIFLAAGDKIKGKTGDEILEEARVEERDQLTKSIAQDATQVQQARSERAKYAGVLDNLRISDASYHADRDMIGQAEPEIKFTLTNESKVPVKAIMLDGRLTSPGRAVPWIVAPVSYDIPGGIEPGESKPFDLAPNMFGDWKASDDFAGRKDLMLTLSVANAEGADGSAFLKGDPADLQKTLDDMKDRQHRLDQLNQQHS